MRFVDTLGKEHLLNDEAVDWQICWDTTNGSISIFNGTGCEVFPVYDPESTEQELPITANNKIAFSAYALAIARHFGREVEQIGDTFAYRIV